MGAKVSGCLGVSRHRKPESDHRLMNSALMEGHLSAAGRQLLRPPPPAAPQHQHQHQQANSSLNQHSPPQQAQAPRPPASYLKPPGPLPKLLRQSSSLLSQQQQQQQPAAANQQANSQQQQQQQPQQQTFQQQQQQNNNNKLVDIDDSSLNSSDLLGGCTNSNNNAAKKPNGGQQLPADLIGGAGDQGSAGALFMQSIRMNPQEVKVLIALYDYEPRTTEDLGFRKGEHLRTTSSLMNGDWWLARSKSTKKIGYVPSNYVAELKSLGAEPWYLGKIGRSEAEMRLQMPDNKDGAFIIRDSDTPTSHQYSLSVKHNASVKHYRICIFDAGGFYINKKTVFSTIHDLVLHYSNQPDGLCINLREPCSANFDKPQTVGLSYETCDRWEIERNSLTLLHELGRGQFGQVFEGLYNNKTRVAIKTLRKGSMDPKDFLGEAQIMKKMRHENLVQLYAVCTKEEPIYIITELMSKGALISYLQTNEGKNLPFGEYIKMATQIASGMSYLERESYVHRDLAARNILVGDNNICKIADFGLARFIKETEYEARAGARFPIKWTAPEAASFSKFTIKSDVWSFGIVLYEIVTKGGTPYADMTNADVLSQIDKGYRMPQPANCESKYYGIMVECWHKDPMKRPTFETLHWKLKGYFQSDEQYREASQYRSELR